MAFNVPPCHEQVHIMALNSLKSIFSSDFGQENQMGLSEKFGESVNKVRVWANSFSAKYQVNVLTSRSSGTGKKI